MTEAVAHFVGLVTERWLPVFRLLRADLLRPPNDQGTLLIFGEIDTCLSSDEIRTSANVEILLPEYAGVPRHPLLNENIVNVAESTWYPL